MNWHYNQLHARFSFLQYQFGIKYFTLLKQFTFCAIIQEKKILLLNAVNPWHWEKKHNKTAALSYWTFDMGKNLEKLQFF